MAEHIATVILGRNSKLDSSYAAAIPKSSGHSEESAVKYAVREMLAADKRECKSQGDMTPTRRDRVKLFCTISTKGRVMFHPWETQPVCWIKEA